MHVAFVAPYLMGPKVPVQEEGAEGVAETGAVARVDGEVHRSCLEMPR